MGERETHTHTHKMQNSILPRRVLQDREGRGIEDGCKGQTLVSSLQSVMERHQKVNRDEQSILKLKSKPTRKILSLCFQRSDLPLCPSW